MVYETDYWPLFLRIRFGLEGSGSDSYSSSSSDARSIESVNVSTGVSD